MDYKRVIKQFNSKTKEERELEIIQLATWYRYMESGQAGKDTPSLEHYIEEIKNNYKDFGFEI